MTRLKDRPVAIDRLDAMLTRLQLTAIRDQLENLLDHAAKSDMTIREALTFLCEREIARKDQRRIESKARPLSRHTRSRRLRLCRSAVDRCQADP